MKQTLNIAFVYIGLVIGAGFASGREIFEYFCRPSQTDLTGIVFAGIFFFFISYIVMSLAKKVSADNFDDFIALVCPRMKTAVSIYMMAFMFCGFFIMLAASGTLFEDTFNAPFGAGVFALAIFCFFVFSFDVLGLVVINNILVPLLIAGILVLCVSSLALDTPVFLNLDKIKNNILAASLCYVSYNTITLGAVLIPISKNSNLRTIFFASLIGGGTLGVLIFVAWLTLNLYPGAALSFEMPFLALAALHGSTYKIFYAIILFMALCTTAISHGFGVLSRFHIQNFKDRMLVSALFCLLAIPFARFGFSALVSNLYAAFGYMGLIWTGFLIYKYIKQK